MSHILIIASSPISWLALSRNKNFSNRVWSVRLVPDTHLSFIVLNWLYNSNFISSDLTSGLSSVTTFIVVLSVSKFCFIFLLSSCNKLDMYISWEDCVESTWLINIFKNSLAGIGVCRVQYVAYSLIKGAKSIMLLTLNSIPSGEPVLFMVWKKVYIGFESSANTKLANCGLP